MIMQLSHHVVDCPTCGRPVEINPQYVSHEVACGHCRGHFVVNETDDGLTAARPDGVDLMERAEQLLQRANRSAEDTPSDRCDRLFQLLSILNGEGQSGESLVTASEEDECDASQQPTALLVEHRDEVFARIATDMSESGMKVVRAHSAVEALKLCGTYKPTLVVVNLDLPDQSAWSLAGKLRFVDDDVRVWLYQPQASAYDVGMANYLQVDELLDYGGDLLGLSETIIELMADSRQPNGAASDARKASELAAA